jgi:hypothetical protein
VLPQAHCGLSGKKNLFPNFYIRWGGGSPCKPNARTVLNAIEIAIVENLAVRTNCQPPRNNYLPGVDLPQRCTNSIYIGMPSIVGFE